MMFPSSVEDFVPPTPAREDNPLQTAAHNPRFPCRQGTIVSTRLLTEALLLLGRMPERPGVET
jgi:hypothetical protein